MWICQTVDDLRGRRRALAGTVAFVPTMGALHAGHLSLIHGAGNLAEHVIVSLFVNPTQFGPGEDFDRYPRQAAADLQLCEGAGAAGVFCPDVDAMYPPAAAACEVDVPTLAGDLEGAHRPTHFGGVCRVVAKLLNMVQADVACFGLKDYQQYRIIHAMAADLAIPTRIVGLPTVREADGLAMSSRNAYLTAEDRPRALGLSKALEAGRVLVEVDGETDPAAVESAMRQVMASHEVDVDYAAVRHPLTLAPLDSIDPPLTGGVVALVAGRVGEVRLIDNGLLGE